jgi:glycosyltransferase involved in cell wall biosynthesis/SAM-dependent methyltransferase
MNIPTVLHVEVGGSYGGSLRALELYLRHAGPARLRHDLLLYYPTPGAERLRPLVRCLEFLHPAPPAVRPSWVRGRLPAHRPTRSLESAAALALRFAEIKRLAAAIHASGCQLVHVNNTYPFQAPTLMAARIAGVPVAAHLRNPVRDGLWEQSLARRLAMALALHDGQAQVLRRWRLSCDIRICPDGIELPPANAVHAAALRRRLLPENGVLVGSLGRLEPQKGYDDLVAAAAVVLPRYPNVRLAIFGEGAGREALAASIAAHGLQQRVLLPGFEPDAASVLAALDLFLCSSRWEGLPLAVLEALLAGTPVVATNEALAGDPRLHPFLAVPPVPAGPAGLAQALERALLQQRESGQSANAARAAAGQSWVEHEFAPRAAAERLDAALEHALRRPLPARAFYEQVYRRPGWTRASAPSPAQPGARFTKMWYQVFLRHLLPRLPLAGKRVLEVGAGYGYLAPAVEARGGRYIGLDMAESALRQFPPGLRHAHPLAADACRLPFPDATFDVVIGMEVIEHVPDFQASLREMFRVATPGAYVVLSSPNYANLFLPLKLFADWGWPAFRRYLTRQPVDHTFFATRLRRILSRYGEIAECRAVRLHPPLLEQLDYRFGAGHPLARVNSWLFRFEQRLGTRPPWCYLGLHTCFLIRAPGGVPERLSHTA